MPRARPSPSSRSDLGARARHARSLCWPHPRAILPKLAVVVSAIHNVRGCLNNSGRISPGFVRPGVAPAVHDGPEAWRQRRKLWLQVTNVTESAVHVDQWGAGSLLGVGEIGALDADSPIRIVDHLLITSR